MFTEQVHQRLGGAEGVSREPHNQLQRVKEGHQAAHEEPHSLHKEVKVLRTHTDTRPRVRLVELKSLMPERFGKKGEPGRSWRGTLFVWCVQC